MPITVNILYKYTSEFFSSESLYFLAVHESSLCKFSFIFQLYLQVSILLSISCPNIGAPKPTIFTIYIVNFVMKFTFMVLTNTFILLILKTMFLNLIIAPLSVRPIIFTSLLDGSSQMSQKFLKISTSKAKLSLHLLPPSLLFFSHPDLSEHNIHPVILARNLAHSRSFILLFCSISNQLLHSIF